MALAARKTLVTLTRTVSEEWSGQVAGWNGLNDQNREEKDTSLEEFFYTGEQKNGAESEEMSVSKGDFKIVELTARFMMTVTVHQKRKNW